MSPPDGVWSSSGRPVRSLAAAPGRPGRRRDGRGAGGGEGAPGRWVWRRTVERPGRRRACPRVAGGDAQTPRLEDRFRFRRHSSLRSQGVAAGRPSSCTLTRGARAMRTRALRAPARPEYPAQRCTCPRHLPIEFSADDTGLITKRRWPRPRARRQARHQLTHLGRRPGPAQPGHHRHSRPNWIGSKCTTTPCACTRGSAT